VIVGQCKAPVGSVNDCSSQNAVTIQADANGNYSTPLVVSRYLVTSGSGTVDCAAYFNRCIAAAAEASNPSMTAVGTGLGFGKVAASPSWGLVDQREIAVSGGGFTPGSTVGVLQCAAEATSGAECNLQNYLGVTADAAGNYSTAFVVSEDLPTSGLGVIDCAADPGRCIVAAVENGDPATAAKVRLGFGFATVGVSRSVGLFDQLPVTVSGAGFTPDTEVMVVQCASEATSAAECDPHYEVTIANSFSGYYEMTWVIKQELQTMGLGAVDCAASVGRCMIVALESGNLATAVATPISLRMPLGGEWISVSSGSNHTVAVRADGTLWAWGSGFLGNGVHTEWQDLPIQIGTDTNWQSVYAGYNHTHGIRADGTLWSWGESSLEPEQVGEDGDWESVGNDFALKENGTLWTLNPLAQFGTDTWTDISNGGEHIVGIKTDGSLWAWGDATYGRLGVGSLAPGEPNYYPDPLRVGAATDDWLDVSAGLEHTLGIRADGTLWSWGRNDYGQLGNGLGDQTVPVQVGSDNDWQTADGSQWTSFAIRTDGSLWSWGLNFIGMLGDGTTMNRNVPTPIYGPGTWASVSPYSLHTMAIRQDGTLWTWGWNWTGVLGTGEPACCWDVPYPTHPIPTQV
jgi:alpha-tubulin suppressor-like RCC1 family protein